MFRREGVVKKNDTGRDDLGGRPVTERVLTLENNPQVKGIIPQWHYYQTPLTSTSWDGDAHSTTAKTLIDLSTVFTNAAGETVPEGAKAVLMRVVVRDSGSAAAADTELVLGPTDADGWGMYARCNGLPNDALADHCIVCPCNSDGDIYYQIYASGVNTLDARIQIWGYWL